MERERRLTVFRVLMGTRRNTMAAEHVQALNLIDIEFAKDTKVIERWHDLLQHFTITHARRAGEEAAEGMTQDMVSANQSKFDKRLFDERQKLLAKLLQEMGKKLEFDLEQFDIAEGGYYPSGLGNIELQQQAIRTLLVDIYLGHRVFPISVRELQEQQTQEQSD